MSNSTVRLNVVVGQHRRSSADPAEVPEEITPMPIALTTARSPAFVDWGLIAAEDEITRYHESGHAVADYLLRFQPRKITHNLEEYDRRTTAFLRTDNLLTPHGQQRAMDFAVALIAGPVAEAKFCGVPLADLRETSGQGDYLKVDNLLNLVTIFPKFTECQREVHAAYLHLLEARAVALMNRNHVWSAVESLADELDQRSGIISRAELVEAIERGMYPTNPCR